MKSLRRTILGLLIVCVQASRPQPVLARTQEIKIFPGNGQIRFVINLAVNFQIARPVYPVSGTFEHFRGLIRYDPSDLTSGHIEWLVDVRSIQTGIAKRNHHLTTSDYFNADLNPTIHFVSEAVHASSDPAHFRVTGNLTMCGVTRRINVPMAIEGHWLSSSFSILRSDFGFNAGRPAIANRVDIRVRVYPSPSWFPVP